MNDTKKKKKKSEQERRQRGRTKNKEKLASIFRKKNKRGCPIPQTPHHP
jgi:hypothetical protein